MTRDDLEKELWRRKGNASPVYAHAVLKNDMEMGDGISAYTCKAGSTVLLTMFSRFGHVGIRGRDLLNIEDDCNYDTCVSTDDLDGITFLDPRAGRVPGWRNPLYFDSTFDGVGYLQHIESLVTEKNLLHVSKNPRVGRLFDVDVYTDFALSPASIAPYVKPIVSLVWKAEHALDGHRFNDIEVGVVAGEVRVWKVLRGV